MAEDGAAEADIEIAARVAARELRVDTRPEVRVTYPGSGSRDSHQKTRRQNVDTPVEPGKTYRSVFVATRISSRLRDVDEPRTDGQAPPGSAGETLDPGESPAR